MFIRLTRLMLTGETDGPVTVNSDQIVTIRRRDGATEIALSTGDAVRVTETLADVATALGLPAASGTPAAPTVQP